MADRLETDHRRGIRLQLRDLGDHDVIENGVPSATYNPTPSGQATTDPFVDYATAWSKPGLKFVTWLIRNSGVNGLSYQIQGSIDGILWHTIVTSANVAAGVNAVSLVSDYWPFMKVQVRSQVGGSPTTAIVQGAAIS
jgi:hypothetical protein